MVLPKCTFCFAPADLLLLAMGFRWLADKSIVQSPENIPELAFVSVMLNIITIGDLGTASETPVWDEVFRLAYYLMLFFAIIISGNFGGLSIFFNYWARECGSNTAFTDGFLVCQRSVSCADIVD